MSQYPHRVVLHQQVGSQLQTQLNGLRTLSRMLRTIGESLVAPSPGSPSTRASALAVSDPGTATTLFGMAGLVIDARITCPLCGFTKLETMAVDACRVVYRCEGCDGVLRPLTGDCCVFCSYADSRCPPTQVAV